MSAFKKRRREFETPECVSCGSDNVVTDTKQGHMVCDDCGVILEASMISASTEYRNFSESDKPTGECALTSCGRATRLHDNTTTSRAAYHLETVPVAFRMLSAMWLSIHATGAA